MDRLITKLKEAYKKPVIQNAIDAVIVALMEQFLEPRGFQIVKIETQNEAE